MSAPFPRRRFSRCFQAGKSGYVPKNSLSCAPGLRARRGQKPAAAFTLVELLVTMAILMILMVVLVSMVGQTSTLWQRTSSKVEQFREARRGFEAVTRRLSQATLNTYWDYDNPTTPTRYLRQSELRFISGRGLLAGVTPNDPRPTHSIFFYAPLGFVQPSSATDTTYANYQGLDTLLNLWGYFIEYANDKAMLPPFVPENKARKRFRLLELMQPSQALDLYKLEADAATPQGGTNGNLNYTAQTWFKNVVGAQPRPVHVLAENIIALVLLPKLTKTDQAKLPSSSAGAFTDASLAPKYLYDSTGTGMSTTGTPALNPTNQLPPVVQVTMVAIDEASAIRMSDQDNADLQNELAGLFTDPTKLVSDLTGKPSPPANGLPLEQYLTSKRINYRVFTSDVSIRAAKWSTNQAN